LTSRSDNLTRPGAGLSHRQQQIVAALDRLGEATAVEILEALPDNISNSAIRTHLRLLAAKGYVTHREDGPRFVYLPTQPKNSAAISALRQVVQTFFGGSVEQTVTTLLSESDIQLPPEELDRLAASIEVARQRETVGGREQ
jgi:predicted transcriptional regulator